MLLSRTMTAPTNFRAQVERVETSRAMFMKYSSHETRTRVGGAAPAGTAGCPASSRVGGSRESTRTPVGRAEPEHKTAPMGCGEFELGSYPPHRLSERMIPESVLQKLDGLPAQP